MHRTDLVTPFAPGPSLASRRSTGFLRLSSSAILLASCTILFTAQCHAQSQTQTTDQDVAEAARQERARKEALQKKSQHVYTEEDLKHAQILTPEDRAQVVARKNQQAPPPAAEKSEQAADAQSLPPDAPLGDVARHFRQQKQLQKLQQTADFHIPFADAPKLASPNPTVLPSPEPPVLASPKPRVFNLPKPLLQPRLPNTYKSLAPRFAPFPPPVKRSPFERPKFLVPEPTMASPTRPTVEPKRVVPFRSATAPTLPPPSRPTAQPKLTAPSHPPVAPKFFARVPTVVNPKSTAPARPLTVLNLPAKPPMLPKLTVPAPPAVVPTQPVKPPAFRVAPIKPSIPRGISTQRNVITIKRGDSLWKLAKQNLGSGLRWRELLSANPTILNPNRIFAGSQIVLPPANSYHAATRSTHPSLSLPLPLFNVGAGLAPPVFSLSTLPPPHPAP